MATVADLLREIAKTQLEEYFKIALTIMKSEAFSSIKPWVQKTGLAKIELALCEAYMEVLRERHKKLEEEVKRHARRPARPRGRRRS